MIDSVFDAQGWSETTREPNRRGGDNHVKNTAS